MSETLKTSQAELFEKARSDARAQTEQALENMVQNEHELRVLVETLGPDQAARLRSLLENAEKARASFSADMRKLDERLADLS